MFKKVIFILCAISCSFLSAGNKKVFIPSAQGELVEQKVDQKNIQENSDENLNLENDFAPSSAYKHTFLKMMLTLIALVVLCIFTVLFFKKLTKSRIEAVNNLKSIKILEKRALSAKSMLYLVEFEGKKILLSESHLEVRMTSID
jgi:flagellar biogenesis protein FliO